MMMDRWTPPVLAGIALCFVAVTAFSHADRGQTEAASHPSPEARAGRRAWQRHNCAACHQLYGLGGYLGPDLTNVIERRGRPHVENVLRSGFAPMPKLDLSDEEIRDLAAWLEYAGMTGTWPKRPARGLE
jgi:nitric oxide reductase subunit C